MASAAWTEDPSEYVRDNLEGLKEAQADAQRAKDGIERGLLAARRANPDEFLALLRELREAGVTLEELGTMLGVSKQRVGQLLK